MTQPDGLEPTGAANYDSFAGFANTTQAEWEARMRDGIDTHFSPWSGICLMLESIPFLGDLIRMAGGTDGKNFGVIEAIFNGLFGFAESLCTMILGTGEPSAGTTPTTILGGAGGIFGQITNSPLFTGLLDLAESTGNLVSDIIDGFMKFANLLCGIVTGNPAPNPDGTTPQTIISGFTGVFDLITGSSFITGFIDLAQQSGTFVLQILDGIVNFIDQIWEMFAALIPGDLGLSSPLGLLDLFSTWLTPILDFVESIMGVGLDVIGAFFHIMTDIVSIFGAPLGLGTGSVSFGSLASIPFLAPLQSLINIFTGSSGGLLSGVTNAWTNLLSLFNIGSLASLATSPASFLGTIPTVITGFASAILNPIGFFANLILGLIPGYQIPPLDGSKITSGVIGDSYTGIEEFRNAIENGLAGTTGASGATNASLQAQASQTATTASGALQAAAQMNAALAAQAAYVAANAGVGGLNISFAPGGAPGAPIG